jgi:hypothetical protein
VDFRLRNLAVSGPEGRQILAHGVSRGNDGRPDQALAPEGRQRLVPLLIGAQDAVPFPEGLSPLWGWEHLNRTAAPTAHGVGYFLTPRRGSRCP